MSNARSAGIAGIVSLICFIGSLIAYGSPPSVDATPGELAGYVADTGSFAIGNVLGVVAALAMLVFLVLFAQRLRAGGGDDAHATLLVSSAVVATALMCVAAGLFSVLDNRLDRLDDAAVTVLWDAGNMSYAVSVVVFAVGAAAAGRLILAGSVFPRWLGQLSWVAAVLALAALTPFFSSGAAGMAGVLGGYVGFLVWMIAVIVVLMRTRA